MDLCPPPAAQPHQFCSSPQQSTLPGWQEARFAPFAGLWQLYCQMGSPTHLFHQKHCPRSTLPQALVQCLVAHIKGHSIRHLQLFNPATTLYGGESSTHIHRATCFCRSNWKPEQTLSLASKQWFNEWTLLLEDLDPSLRRLRPGHEPRKMWLPRELCSKRARKWRTLCLQIVLKRRLRTLHNSGNIEALWESQKRWENRTS